MSDADNRLPIHALIEERKFALGLKESGLAQRCGYANLSKGIRRLNELGGGRLELPDLIKTLPFALEVPAAAVSQAIEDTRRILHERRAAELQAEEDAWRAAFVPHAIALTANRCPEPIFVASLLGVKRLLFIAFDHTKPEHTFPRQALDGLAEKLNREGWGTLIPAFGRPTGVTVNYTPDHAVAYDLSERPVQILDKARRLGLATLRFT